MDPEALDFLQCHIRSPDGQELPARWFCNVRILDALDEERSEVRDCCRQQRQQDL